MSFGLRRQKEPKPVLEQVDVCHISETIDNVPVDLPDTEVGCTDAINGSAGSQILVPVCDPAPSLALVTPAPDATPIERNPFLEGAAHAGLLLTGSLTGSLGPMAVMTHTSNTVVEVACMGVMISTNVGFAALTKWRGERISDRLFYRRKARKLNGQEGGPQLRQGMVAPKGFPKQGQLYAQLTVDENKGLFMVAIQHWQKQALERMDWHWIPGSQQWFENYEDAYRALVCLQENLVVNHRLQQNINGFNARSKNTKQSYSYRRELKHHLQDEITFQQRMSRPLALPVYRVGWSLAWQNQKFAVAVAMLENGRTIESTIEVFAAEQIQEAMECSKKLALQKQHYRKQALRTMAANKDWMCFLVAENQPDRQRANGPETASQPVLSGCDSTLFEQTNIDTMKVQAYGNKP